MHNLVALCQEHDKAHKTWQMVILRVVNCLCNLMKIFVKSMANQLWPIMFGDTSSWLWESYKSDFQQLLSVMS